MNRPIYWGLGLLLILLIAGGAFVFYSQHNELQQLKQQASQKRRQAHEASVSAFQKDHQRIMQLFDKWDKDDVSVNERFAALMVQHEQSLASDEVFDAEMAEMDAEFKTDYADIMDFIGKTFVTDPNGVIQRKSDSIE